MCATRLQALDSDAILSNLRLLVQAETEAEHFGGERVGDAPRDQAESFHCCSIIHSAVMAVNFQPRPLAYANAHGAENHTDRQQNQTEQLSVRVYAIDNAMYNGSGDTRIS